MIENKDVSKRTRLLGTTALAARYCVSLEHAQESEKSEFIVNMLRLLPQLYLDFSEFPDESPALASADAEDGHHHCSCHHHHDDEDDHDCCGDDCCGHHHHGEECDEECGDDDCYCGCHHHHHHHDEDDADDYSGLTPLEEETDEDDDDFYYGSYMDEDYYESIRRHVETLLGPDDVFLETFEEDMRYSETPIAASISESLADIFQPLYNFISVVKETEGEALEGAYRRCSAEFREYWSQTLCNVLRALNNLRYKGPDAE